jgi:hypothetical protein
MPGLDRFQLDGHLFTVGDVDAEVDVAKTSAPNLTDLKFENSNFLT